MSEEESSAPVKTNKAKISYQTFFKYDKNEEGGKIGICLLCKDNKIVKEIPMKNSNTSGLKYHLEKAHTKEFEELFGAEKNKKVPLSNKQSSLNSFVKPNETKNRNWDRTLTVWVGHKKLPFNFFDDNETQEFFSQLNPAVKMPKRHALKKIVMVEFSKMKTNLQQVLISNSSKFSFTTDGWTAPNGRSYYGITIHFIDEKWNLHSLALDLVPSDGSHAGKDIARYFHQVLVEYNIENKVQGITVDNASANTTFMDELGAILFDRDIQFDVEDQHFRCFPHILNLAIQDIIKLLNVKLNDHVDFYKQADEELSDFTDDEYHDNCDDGVIESDDSILPSDVGIFANVLMKIRTTCKKIRCSEQLTRRLELFCQAEGIKFVKPVLDVATRWDSTYDMMNTAKRLKPALNMMWEKCANLMHFNLSNKEWLCVEQLLEYMVHFKCISRMLGKEQQITLPTVIVAINVLIDKLENLIFELDRKDDRDENDEILLLAFQASRDKILKHYVKCNWVYCVALILDPRHKKYSFNLTSWGKDLEKDSVDKFENLYRTDYYRDKIQESVQMEDNLLDISDDEENLNYAHIYNSQEGGFTWRSEIDAYYNAPRASKETDVLQWWKVHENVYPTIAKMARDILSVSASSVPVERLFSSGSLVMNNRRTCLSDDSLKTLVCINSWSKCSLKEQICYTDL